MTLIKHKRLNMFYMHFDGLNIYITSNRNDAPKYFDDVAAEKILNLLPPAVASELIIIERNL